MASSVRPSSARDLQYGEALFHYFQDDWFGSIVRLQIAKQQQALPHHADEAELLLGGLDLSYGLRDEAGRIFHRLLAEHSDAPTRNRAWYYLAKISWQRDDPDAALDALQRLQGDMNNGTRAESAQLGSLILLQLGRNEEAIRMIGQARAAGAWTPYLAFNLGVAQLRSGQFDAGAVTLAGVGELRGESAEQRALRDKANLALGYSYLQQGRSKQSRRQLQQVRLEGPYSNRALLGSGWADADNQAFRQALAPWTELAGRNATDPAVQEAMLAMPYAYTKLKLHGRAVAGYNSAIDAMRDEQQKLDRSIEAIARGELLKVLERQDLSHGSGWLQQLTLDSQSPALRYQLTLMSSNDFQEAVKNYRDLLQLRDNLTHWADSMAAFDDMLLARRTRFVNNRPAAERALKSTELKHLQQRHAALSVRLQEARTGSDPLALANDTETRQLEKLQRIRATLARLPVSAQTDLMHTRVARLAGVLRWQIASDFGPRQWQARRALDAISAALAQGRQTLAAMAQARTGTPAEFDARARQIQALRQTIRRLLARTDTIRVAQGQQLQQLAVRELQAQKARIDTYVVQARYALAQTYDSALHVQAGDPP